ncbi:MULTISPECIES: pyruvate formate-lyase-activating protein [unclassified Uliginosibacterium]|uniref:pyruvate formate-lyase-activating protein n=1 Tax=unclassified Uliginosibacterium TaxID=2621521 RepID=UPI00156E69F5|nr:MULTISPECIES: pyruvate formate-lyase-activating protein [unclassified Uliginosibacterium]MDO6388023.1 pyruvate formate-lyase-activating protein [Uliginosibacterium sp. 31-12]
MSTEHKIERPLKGSRFELRALDSNMDDADAERLAQEGRWGFLHSEETGSAVDGPGMRVVFWTTGCEFRCTYCHNPDTWKLKHGQVVCADDILDELKKYKDYLRFSGGGLTISGGEPLVQAPFVMNIIRGAREMGIHTCLDTNGYLGDRLSDADLSQIDLFLLDLKSWDPETHLKVTAKQVEPVLNFARRLAARGRPMWVRFVLVPGHTDAPDNIKGVAAFAASLGNVERVDVLPFHQLGRFKWEQLGMKYELTDTPTPKPEETEAVKAVFRAYGLNCPS